VASVDVLGWSHWVSRLFQNERLCSCPPYSVFGEGLDDLSVDDIPVSTEVDG